MNSERRWREFVEDANGVGSSIRLCMVFGVFLGGVVIVILTVQHALTWEMYATFLAASGGVYGWGKYRESVETVEQTRADSPNPPPAPPAPAPAPQPSTTNINVLPAKGAGE